MSYTIAGTRLAKDYLTDSYLVCNASTIGSDIDYEPIKVVTLLYSLIALAVLFLISFFFFSAEFALTKIQRENRQSGREAENKRSFSNASYGTGVDGYAEIVKFHRFLQNIDAIDILAVNRSNLLAVLNHINLVQIEMANLANRLQNEIDENLPVDSGT